LEIKVENGIIVFLYNFTLGAVHKGRPQSGGRGVCPVRTFFGQGGRGSSK